MMKRKEINQHKKEIKEVINNVYDGSDKLHASCIGEVDRLIKEYNEVIAANTMEIKDALTVLVTKLIELIYHISNTEVCSEMWKVVRSIHSMNRLTSVRNSLETVIEDIETDKKERKAEAKKKTKEVWPVAAPDVETVDNTNDEEE